eukprot:365413-Chlamydomonas_euryale.AAC.4
MAHGAWHMHACSVCVRGPECLPLCESEAGRSVYKTCVEATGGGRGQPETEDMQACPPASGLGHSHACISEAEERPRPKQA